MSQDKYFYFTGETFFKLSVMHIFYQLSFQLVLYSCILYMYSSDREILPGVNACLYVIFHCWEKKKKGSPASDGFLAVRALVFKDADRKKDALSNTVEVNMWGLCITGLLSYAFYIMQAFVWFCEDVQDLVYSDLMPTAFTSCHLRPVAAFYHVHLCISSCTILISISWPDCVTVQCVIETLR